jgi:hypothetical protein
VIHEIPISTELQVTTTSSTYQHSHALQKEEGESESEEEEKQNATSTPDTTESDRIHIKPETGDTDIVHLRLQDLPFSQQVRKPAFLLLTLCFASTLLSIQFFIGKPDTNTTLTSQTLSFTSLTIDSSPCDSLSSFLPFLSCVFSPKTATFNDQMERKASGKEESAFYINFMGTVSAMGFVMMPLTVLVMDGPRWWQGYTSAWILQLVLVLLTNIINLSPISLTEEIVEVDSSSGDGSVVGSGSVSGSHLEGSGSEVVYLVYKPAVVYTLCWVWSISRYFMFTIFFAFTAEQFGQKTFGRITGTASLAASLVGLLVYPLADLTLETLDGNYDYVHLVLAILVGSFLLWYPLYVKRTTQPRVT